MEKFSLKWNDFQVNVSKSFHSLRHERDFFDVTLVSDDEQHLSAHKVVLSASSEFFKNILKKANHSSPMIFLSGVNSKNLSFVMDYIYQGEVQILQDELDGFLDTAQKLKIDGLIGSNNHEGEEQETVIDYEEETKATVLPNNKAEMDSPVQKPKRRIYENHSNHSRDLALNTSNIDAKAAVDDLVIKTQDGYECKACGKRMKTLDIRRHAEIHIEGLSIECPVCNKTFRSRNSLNFHKSSFHKTF